MIASNHARKRSGVALDAGNGRQSRARSLKSSDLRRRKLKLAAAAKSRPASRVVKLAARARAIGAQTALPLSPARTKAGQGLKLRPVKAARPARAGAAKGRPVIGDAEVRPYLPLVRQVVQRMLPRKPPEIATEDLISWGTVGLLDAMAKYDRTREAAFPTYAQYRIRGAILDYLRRCDWLPRSVRQRTHDVEQATVELERKLGRAPEAQEIASALGLSLEEYAQTISSIGNASLVPAADLGFGKGEETLSCDDLMSDGGESGPISKVLRKEKVEILARAIEQLPEKERIVVSFYYFEGLTMREMAEALHLTEGRISQLHSQAMLRLRGSLSDLHQQQLLC